MDTIAALNDLIHLDIDAIRAYEHAIKACDHEAVASQLRSFQDDHRRHVLDLGNEVAKLGGKAPDKPDVKGFFIAGFTAVTSIGTHSALVAMQGNEKLTTSRYAAAIELQEITPEIRTIITRNYQDEQRHLAWIQQALQNKVWEQEARV